MLKPESGPIRDASALDETWYARLEQYGAFQGYEYLDGDKSYRDEQKQAFLTGEIANPVLDYPKINLVRLAEDEEALLILKRDLLLGEANEVVKQAYRWKLNMKIAELRMLRAVALDDMNRFKRYSEFIYGKPSREVFAGTVEGLRRDATEALASESPDLIQAAHGLLELLPADLPDGKIEALPSQETVERVRTETLREMQNLLPAEGHESRKYLAEEIKTVFEGVLQSMNAEGWSVVVDTGSKSGISVDQEKKAVKIPESRSLSFQKLRTLIAHELGTHVARRLNGERSKLRLLGLGLDRYEQGEEGVATMREQVLEGEIEDFTGLEGHLAIALASGLDGSPRDFREVYTVMERHFYFKALKAGKPPDQARTSAQTNAWNRTVRTFRGTDCKTKGVCFTKDIIYREGNIGVWNLVKTETEELERFSIGKYDPTNERHIWILNQLGLSDEDLSGLEA